jgi:tetratricopeptide (TPR) repeat protein
MRFWKNGVVALIGQEKARAVESALERLIRAEVLAPSRGSRPYDEHEFEFRHAIVQDAAYAMLTDSDRQLGHRLAAAWLFERGERDPMTLAVHAERGADPSAASAWYLVAADQALEGTDLQAAIERAERALTAGTTPEQRGIARRIQAEASFWGGDQQAARERADEALSLLAPGTVAWFDAALFALSARSQIGDATGMLALMDVVRKTEAHPAAQITKLQTLATTAGYLTLQGQAELADAVLSAIEPDAMAASVEHPGVLARFSVSRAILAYVRGELGAYIDGTRNAAQLFLAAGDMRRELTQRANLAHALVECGAYAAAIPIAREVEIGASRLGLAHTVALTRQNMALALAMQGSFEEAEKMERAALEEFARGGHKRLEGACHIYLAQIALEASDPARAVDEAKRATEVLAASPPLMPFALAVLANALAKAGQRDVARRHATRALTLLGELGGVGEGTTYVLLAAAETAHEAEVARSLIERAVKHVRARGATLEDRALRDSFFGRVPENVRLLELARLAGV